MILFQKDFKTLIDNKHLSEVISNENYEDAYDRCALALDDAHVFNFYNYKPNPDTERLDAIDLPFKKCLFQTKKDSPFFGIDPQAVREYIKESGQNFGSSVRLVYSVLVEEITPLNYDIFMISENVPKFHDEIKYLSFHHYNSHRDKNSHEVMCIIGHIQAIMNSLRGQSFARESVKESIKIKVKGHKKQIKISNVTHVYPNKMTTPKGIHGKVLEWSHRWEVRGHWRKIKGLGKDRTGSYNQEGFTWVVNHEKGPLEKELVQKITVVH